MERDKDKRLGHKPNPPGTVWAYNNWDYNALTTIVEADQIYNELVLESKNRFRHEVQNSNHC
jgi:hypothetical protein